MNMTKIAKLAGCSLSTVSKAFSNSDEISSETKEKIFEIAKKHNCFTKYYSPVLNKYVFGVICNELSGSSIYGEIVGALNKRIYDNGDLLLASSNGFVSSVGDEILDYYINFHKVDGLIIIDGAKFENSVWKNIPTVSIGSLYKEKIHYCDCVNTDRSFGVYQAVSHLKEMGHRDIAFIGEYLTSGALKSFRKAMADCSLDVNEDWLVTSSKRMGEAGYDAMDKLISLPQRPTAVFAAYDAMALGAINRVYSAGLCVPEDISIIGVNNIPMSRFSTPPLTTVSTPIEEIADAALNLLYRRIRFRESPYQSVSIQSNLTIRESVKNLNK